MANSRTPAELKNCKLENPSLLFLASRSLSGSDGFWALASHMCYSSFAAIRQRDVFHWPFFGPTALLCDLYGSRLNCRHFHVSQHHLFSTEHDNNVTESASVFLQVFFPNAIKVIHAQCYSMKPFLIFQSLINSILIALSASRAVKICQKTHPFNRFMPQRLIV